MHLFALLVLTTAATVLACWGAFLWATKASRSGEDGPGE
jgi:hypothetical protein